MFPLPREIRSTALVMCVALQLAALGSAASADLAHRVHDINPGTWSTEWGGVCGWTERSPAREFAGIVLADADGAGCKVFRVNATTTGLIPVSSFGDFGADAGEMFGTSGPVAYFEASNLTTGLELWRSDGTASGTFFLHESRPGPDGSPWSFWLEAAEPTSYFVGHGEATGREIWATDGTRGGTRLVRDIWPGTGHAVSESDRQAWGDLLFFVADDGVAGPEVWRTDGSESGTFALSSLPFAPGYGALVRFAPLQDAVLFLSLLPDFRTGLWRTDGTPTGTALIWSSSTPLGSQPDRISTIGNNVLFAFDEAGELEIWSSNGTAAGTVQVAALAASSGGWFPGFFPAGSRALFIAADAAHGREPWVTDGTAAGTGLLADVRPGPEDSFDSNFGVSVAVLGDLLLLVLDDGVHGAEIWRTDGTPAGTTLLVDSAPGAQSARFDLWGERNGYELFSVWRQGFAAQLWRTDGTSGGTLPITALGGALSPSYPESLTDAGALLFLTARAEQDSRWPWRTDGSEPGTIPLEGDLLGFYTWADFVALDDGTVIANSEGDESSLIWSSTWDEIVPLIEVSYSCGGHHTCGLGHAPPSAGPLALFSHWSAAEGAELWATDGTPLGTGLWLDLLPGPEWSGPRNIIDVGEEVWFTALDAAGIEHAWRSRGTPASTEPFAALAQAPGSERAEEVWPLNPQAEQFFFLREEDDGRELWYSAGDGSSPLLLKYGLRPEVFPIGVAGERLIFGGAEYDDPGVGMELWASDGTPAGTRLVRDIWSGPLDSELSTGIELGGRVFFRACEPMGGCELWVSDGTTDGTSRFLDLAPGPASSRPFGLSRIGDRIYFGACQLGTGCETWVTDGSPAGTHRLEELVPGPYPSLHPPSWFSWGQEPRFVVSAGSIYFAADDGTGEELWAMPPEIFYDGFETGDASRWSPPTPP